MFGTIINTYSKRLFHSIFCTFLPTLGTPPTIAAPCFLNKPAITNIVGYQTFVGAKNDYILKSIQFDGITGDLNVRDISGTFTGVPYDDDGNFASTAPCLMVRTAAGGYDTYYYLSDGVWDASIGDYGPGWCDQGGSELAPGVGDIPAGTAAWYVDQNVTPGVLSSSLTVAGEVLSDASVTTSFGNGYTLSAVPYPKGISFNDITFEGLTGVPYDDDGNFASTAPCLMVRTAAGGYDTYYYLSDGVWDASISDYGPGWCDQGGSELPSYATEAIAAGTAFWVYLPDGCSSFSAKFTR